MVEPAEVTFRLDWMTNLINDGDERSRCVDVGIERIGVLFLDRRQESLRDRVHLTGQNAELIE